MAVPIVYLLTNKVNGKRYVGVTRVPLNDRLSRHWNAAKSGRPTRIAAAIRKYGRSAFVATVLLEYPTYEAALAAERGFIANLKPEYNVTAGGEGVHGLKMSDATKAKLSAANKGRPGSFTGRKHSAASKEKMRKAHLGSVGPWRGKPRDRYVIEAMRQANLGGHGPWFGKTRSQATKDKISAANKGKPPPPSTPALRQLWADNMRRAATARQRSVLCVTTGRQFESITLAAAACGTDKGNVWAACNGKRKSAGGLQFSYVEAAT